MSIRHDPSSTADGRRKSWFDGAPMAHRSKREQGLTGEAMPLAERLSSAIGTD
jgi:hypothetical protein